MDELTLTLHHPLTDKEWDDITDVDFEHTNEITFYTKNGKEVVFAKKPHWIPVLEELPEEDKEVLVTVYFHGLKQVHSTGWNDHIRPSYYVETASQIGGNWSSVSDEYKVARNRHEVIAWMPLPEPYKLDEDES